MTGTPRLRTSLTALAFVATASAGMLATTAPANAAASQTSAGVVAQATTVQAARPVVPNITWLCGKKIVKHFIPACSHGRWEPRQVKIMRCIAGHAPYMGWLGPSKLAYWAQKCGRGDWQKW